MAQTLPLGHVLRLLLLAVLGLLIAGCGEDEQKAQSAPAPEPTATAAAADPTDTKVKPVIAKPAGEPPTRLVKRDIVKGSGARARAGDQVSVQYVGVLHSTGEQFDASWDTGQPFSFALGAGDVIAGWDEGVAGMRVGGRRELVIPPDKAYGPAGSPPIGPNETLVFVVDLLEIVAG
jgi:peptidylprolyl isomerase